MSELLEPTLLTGEGEGPAHAHTPAPRLGGAGVPEHLHGLE